MKHFFKVILIAFFISAIFSACSPQKSVAYLAGSARSKFVGTWNCTAVTYEGLVGNAVQKVFDQAPPALFVNSVWILTNSGDGQYTLNDGSSQSIYWSYYNPGGGIDPAFQFKKVYQGDKAKNVDAGYRLAIANADGTSMTLKSPVNLGSKVGYIVYAFTKTK